MKKVSNTKRHSIWSLIGLLFLLIVSIGSPLEAQQDYGFCSNNGISGISWSPDGEKLAVMTSQGVHIYNPDLELIRSIKAPFLNYYHSTGIGPVWSPDSTWIVLPDLVPMEFLNYGGASSSWSIVNVNTEEVLGTWMPDGIRELVWSPDNRFIVGLNYERQMGITLPYSQLTIGSAIDEPRTQRRQAILDDVQLTDLEWQEGDIFTARINGLILSFDSATLELVDSAPTFYPSWWVANHDGTREAAYKETMFFIRNVGQEEQRIDISALETPSGKFRTIGQVSKTYWLLDNQRLIGIYPRMYRFRDEYPELPRLLQGTVIDAETFSEINHFSIFIESEINGYSVSLKGDRIAIYRNRTWVEIWNPLTNEYLKSVEVPLMTFEDICSG